MNDSVLVDIVDGVATVTLNEPDKRNAISLDMVDGISAAFDALEVDEGVGAIVVTGAPPPSAPAPTCPTSAPPGRSGCGTSTRASCASAAARCRPSPRSTGRRSARA